MDTASKLSIRDRVIYISLLVGASLITIAFFTMIVIGVKTTLAAGDVTYEIGDTAAGITVSGLERSDSGDEQTVTLNVALPDGAEAVLVSEYSRLYRGTSSEDSGTITFEVPDAYAVYTLAVSGADPSGEYVYFNIE